VTHLTQDQKVGHEDRIVEELKAARWLRAYKAFRLTGGTLRLPVPKVEMTLEATRSW
jgi:hypothetical protein